MGSQLTHTLSTANLLAEATKADSVAEKSVANAIGSSKPIETLQEFFDWFAVMESEMEKGQEDVYRNHLSIVQLYQQACDEFLQDLNKTCTLFDDLEKDYSFVDLQTRSIQEACEILLAEQHRLTRLAEGLSERLAYFNELEPIAKLFNTYGDKNDICLNKEFIPMLDKLDVCIQYMQDHHQYRDSELYLMRFRQCMTKGITLIKMYVVSTIKELGFEVYKNTKDATLGKQMTMYYVKFKTIASTIKSLTQQVEKRCEGHNEYQSLYEEMLYAYFQTRQQLLSPLIAKKIQQLGPNDKDLLGFVSRQEVT
jgi:hypothetical protein